MWNDPIVEETRRLRDEFAKKHNYSIRAMVAELKQWEQEGFPLPRRTDQDSPSAECSGPDCRTAVRQKDRPPQSRVAGQ